MPCRSFSRPIVSPLRRRAGRRARCLRAGAVEGCGAGAGFSVK